MLTSIAVVVTAASARYAKQLLSHLGRKVVVEDVEGVPHARRLVFAYGAGVVRPETGELLLEAVAPDAESLARVEDVLARHLRRFGQRAELTVSWHRAAD
jgi:hypothetical protein